MGERIPVDQVVFVKELYPRLREDDAAIERYRAAIDRLPPSSSPAAASLSMGSTGGRRTVATGWSTSKPKTWAT